MTKVIELAKSLGLKIHFSQEYSVEGNGILEDYVKNLLAQQKTRKPKQDSSLQIKVGPLTRQLLLALATLGPDVTEARLIIQNAKKIREMNLTSSEKHDYCGKQVWNSQKAKANINAMIFDHKKGDVDILIFHFLDGDTLISEVHYGGGVIISDKEITIGTSIPEASRHAFIDRIKNPQDHKDKPAFMPSELFNMGGYDMDEDMEGPIKAYMWGSQQELLLKLNPKLDDMANLESELVKIHIERMDLANIMSV